MLTAAFLFFILTFLAFFVAYRLGFFNMDEGRFLPPLKRGLLFFSLYLLLFFFFSTLTILVLKIVSPPTIDFLASRPSLNVTVFHVITLAVSIGFLALFFVFQGKKATLSIWKTPKPQRPSSLFGDLKLSFFAYLLAFPLVTFISSFFQWIIIAVLKTQPSEQIAVRMVQSLEGMPISTLLVFILSIAFFSPVIEEIAFRGILQNTLKKFCPTFIAVIITSALFSLLHLSIRAGLSEAPLFFSLFSLSCVLGFLYERQRSLAAPMGLHILFNSINLVSILFFK